MERTDGLSSGQVVSGELRFGSGLMPGVVRKAELRCGRLWSDRLGSGTLRFGEDCCGRVGCGSGRKAGMVSIGAVRM